MEEKRNKKRRNIKKLAIVTTSVGVIALAPVSPLIPIGVGAAALWSVPAFVYGRQKLLNEELVQCIRDIKEKKDVILQNEPIGIEDLPDNNLIKQAVLKYKNSI